MSDIGSVYGPRVQLEFLLEAIHKLDKQLEGGLSQMKSSTLYKGYKSQLATHEAAHQCVLLTTWEIEAVEHQHTFLTAIHAEHVEQFGGAEKELQCYTRIFSQCSLANTAEDKDYIQAIYEDECQALHVINAQADQVVKLLSKRIKDTFLAHSGGFLLYPSGIPCFGEVDDRGPTDTDDSDGSDDGICMSDPNLNDLGRDLGHEELDG
ncbi:uncharacterized protein EDB93DRAFT_1105885 [Suillus bovinus]|uniref:uncharacterized protein n=1 Tax=Suillus bovinus TaxID=48563 RepID=UPI001B8764DA|nr:uncharacterized protein EDB93DRAFT_1105885 [Suillus bovinus]KAG2140474.1 hypothetical protein EDB93DRAFT_1105885 [Suillus bovinus]